MPELVLHTSPIDCGKSTPTLQLDHTRSTHGRQGRVSISWDRSGRARISSRLGLETPVTEVDEEFDFWIRVIAQLVTGKRIDYLICNEAQFYTEEQVKQLARVVDELQIDIYIFGILADFRTELSPGSQRSVELASRMETLPIGPSCWYGAKGTHNTRTVSGLMVTEGSQVVMGDTGVEEIRYEVFCRVHHRRRMATTRARATLREDPLPFGE